MNINLIEKLHKRTEIKEKCWLWKGGLVNNYGVFSYNGESRNISRYSLCIYLGLKYKDNSWVACHIDSICKYKNCWNPLHIYAGTHKSNIRDLIIKGTHISVYEANRTHCPRDHEYTEENTYFDRLGKRHCKICKKIHNKNRVYIGKVYQRLNKI